MGQAPEQAIQDGAETPVSLPAPHPSTGILCKSRKGLSYDDLVFSVTNHHMKKPLPVRPVVMGFLPFDDGQIAPRYVLKGQDLLAIRLGIVSKSVPPAAIKRLMAERKESYEAAHGSAMPAVASRLLRSDCVTDLLATTHAAERDALIFYQPSTGSTFVAEQGLNQALVVVKALTTLVPQLECRFWRPPTNSGTQLRNWVLQEAAPAGLEFGDSIKIETEAGATAAFRKAKMTSPDVLAHLSGGSSVLEIGLRYEGDASPLAFSFESSGVLRRIRIEDCDDHDGLCGLSLVLAAMVEFSDAIFPCFRALSAALQSGAED